VAAEELGQSVVEERHRLDEIAGQPKSRLVEPEPA